MPNQKILVELNVWDKGTGAFSIDKNRKIRHYELISMSSRTRLRALTYSSSIDCSPSVTGASAGFWIKRKGE